MSGAGASAATGSHRRVGRYELFMQIAAGGMATVHLGRVVGAGRFARAVAIKRLHEQFARDGDFRQMFLNEAEVLARVRHPSVVPTLDLIEQDEALFIVMEFVEGVTLRQLQAHAAQRSEVVPCPIALAILEGALRGLHAAHDARDELGEPLDLVHRDVSPDNILVGADGLARVFDFGIAKALGRVQTTQSGQVKGKVPYMTPEQLLGHPVTRRSDLFAASIVLWETLTGRRLFASKEVGQTMNRVLVLSVPNPSTVAPHVPKSLDAVVLRGLERDPSKRFASAAEMADALAEVGPVASQSEVAAWVKKLAAARLTELAGMLRTMESTAPLAARGGGRAHDDASGASVEHAGGSAPNTTLAIAVESTDGSAARLRRRRRALLGVAALSTGLAAGLIWATRPSAESGPSSPSAPDPAPSRALPTGGESAARSAWPEPPSSTVAPLPEGPAVPASASASTAVSTSPRPPPRGPVSAKPQPSGSPLYSID